MFISEEDIKEVVDFRPYRELSDRELADLLGAFEEFIPSLELYGSSAERALAAHYGSSASRSLKALTMLIAIEPTVSRSLFELLLESASRLQDRGEPRWPSYTSWGDRGLLYGFDGQALDDVFYLRSEQAR